MKLVSNSLVDTARIASEIVKMLGGRKVICLTGDLGAGKTTLSKALALELGIKSDISSPTYTIVNEYREDVTLFHFDVYRINDIEEMYEIGFDEYLFSGAYVIIEWADKIESLLPDDALRVDIRYGDTETTRVFDIV